MTRNQQAVNHSADAITRDQYEMALIARAMSHPVRIYILELLSGQSCCYSGDLAEVLPIARSTLSQHLKALKDAGLIQGEIRPPKIKYCIHKENWIRAKALFTVFFEDNPLKPPSSCTK